MILGARSLHLFWEQIEPRASKGAEKNAARDQKAKLGEMDLIISCDRDQGRASI